MEDARCLKVNEFFSLRMRSVSEKKFYTHFIFNIFFPFCRNSCLLLDNVVKMSDPDRPYTTIKYGAYQLHAG